MSSAENFKPERKTNIDPNFPDFHLDPAKRAQMKKELMEGGMTEHQAEAQILIKEFEVNSNIAEARKRNSK